MAWGQKGPVRAKGKASKRRNARTRRGLVWTVPPERAELEWCSPGARPAKGRPVWKEPAANPRVRSAPPPVTYRESPVPSLDVEQLLFAGGALVAAHDLCVSPERGVYPLPPLVRYFGDPALAPIRKGSLMMYAGQVRVTERYARGGVGMGYPDIHKDLSVRVMKHTFIAPVGRCILHDLTLLCPA